jgi:flagella basal body P-ring formation protein FlgA
MSAAIGFLVGMAVAAATQCVSLESDSIIGADLAAADPVFSQIPASRLIGYSPAPGRQRVFTTSELKSIADSAGLRVSPARELCFEWRMSAIDTGAAEAAMKEAYPEATIEVIEMSRYPAPEGIVVFPRTGLQRIPAPVMLWRGYVAYSEGRKFDIWARVKVRVRIDRVIAAELLRPGQIIQDDQVRVEQYSGPPLEAGYATSVAEVIGRVPRSVALAGSPIKIAMLDTPVEISRGDVVNVEVRNGAARISLEARAASSGRVGQSVQLQNQNSGKTFRGIVSGSGRAVVVLGSAK